MKLLNKLGNLSRTAKTAIAALALTVATSITFGTAAPQPVQAATNMIVHFIDVGQADAMLVQMPNGQNMVVDAGNNADSTLVVNYLKSKGVSRVDYVVGTHPDEDHIGGLDAVINNFAIGKVFMPAKTSTTQTYNDVINACKAKGLTITTASKNVGIFNTTYNGYTLRAYFIGPAKTYTHNNDNSAVIRLTYGSTTYMLSGDAEVAAETDMVNSGLLLSANILKVGHHGSDTSSTDAYLNKVKPQAGVISVGLNNSYGHPHLTTINKLKSRGIKIYRTDYQGNLVFTNTGTSWYANVSPWWQ